MSTGKKGLSLVAFGAAALTAVVPTASVGNIQGCSFNSIPLKGRVQVVSSFPDIKVQEVSSFADIEVKRVESMPTSCGEWQFVSSSPDFKIQYVTSFPDLKVKFVSSSPGMK